jgi:flagellar basal body-associated protein FliL
MAEDTAAQSTGEQAAASPIPKRKNVIMLGALVGVMAAEAVVVFILVKHFAKAANPPDAHAGSPSGLVAGEGKKASPDLEVKIGEFRVQNRKGQQPYTIAFSVFATVPAPEKKAEAEKGGKGEGGEGGEGGAAAKVRPEDAAVAAKAAKIKDRFTRVIRSMEPDHFTEPDLMTLRGKLKEELSEVLGLELKIQEVLLTDFSCTADN